MPEYNLEFSKNLIEAAGFVLQKGEVSVDAKRTILYLSLLSCEITMKALLEKASKLNSRASRMTSRCIPSESAHFLSTATPGTSSRRRLDRENQVEVIGLVAVPAKAAVDAR